MQTYNNLFNKVYSYENLVKAYNEAKKGKCSLEYVIKFTKNIKEHLLQLQKELKEKTYKPERLTTFIIRDPKLRIISKSIFRDRIIHHALIQVIEPIFEPTFISDSHANRINKGTTKALERCNLFLRKVSKNGTKVIRRGGGRSQNKNFIKGYALKADIKHYFENVNQDILIGIIRRKIKDENLIQLIKLIINNFDGKIKGVGMPLGNLTSQFFANIYLNELDQFVKHNLKVKYYLRYVDDFIIIHRNKEILESYKEKIDLFLKDKLELELHPEKSKIVSLYSGIQFLGFRIFNCNRILRKRAQVRINKKLNAWKEMCDSGLLDRDKALDKLNGWMAYAINGNTYSVRKKVMAKFNKLMPVKINNNVSSGSNLQLK